MASSFLSSYLLRHHHHHLSHRLFLSSSSSSSSSPLSLFLTSSSSLSSSHNLFSRYNFSTEDSSQSTENPVATTKTTASTTTTTTTEEVSTGKDKAKDEERAKRKQERQAKKAAEAAKEAEYAKSSRYGASKKIELIQPLPPRSSPDPLYGPNPFSMPDSEWTKLMINHKDSKMLNWHGIFPDVLPNGFLPHHKIQIKYNDRHLVYLGNILPPTIVSEQPSVSFESPEDKLWTLVMVDPDAPARVKPDYREWLHWLVYNIPGNKVEQGEVLAEYMGAGPPKGTSKHRYVFLLLEQKNKLELSQQPKIGKLQIEGRPGFKVADFIFKHDLRPRGCSFFQAEWDESVSVFYKQLGITEPVFEWKPIQIPKPPSETKSRYYWQ